MTTATPRRPTLPADRRQSAISGRWIHSLYGITPEQCIVMDIGRELSRAGISGEHAPRCTLPLIDTQAEQTEMEDPRLRDVLIDLLDDTTLGVMEDRIERVVREAVNRYLYLPPKGRRVILVESHLLPMKIKKIMARVFFTYQQPREISFMHAGVCSLLAIGISSGIVVDMGSRETTVVPIYDQRPLNTLVRSTRLAATALKSRITYLLGHFSGDRISHITHADLDDFVSTALVCLPKSPLLPELSEFILNQDLESHYALDEYKEKFFSWTQPSTATEFSLPQWIRFASTEILFEPRDIYADSAFRSLPNCVVSAFRASSIDLKSSLRRIVLTGGLSLIPGIGRRIATETGLDIVKHEFGAELAWAGASLATSLRMNGPNVTIQQFNSTGKVPDWSTRILKE